MKTRLPRIARALAGSVTLALLASCGGGGGGGAIAPAAVRITSSGATTAVIGSPFNFVITVTGGTGAKTFSVTGALPAGLALNAATGAITGTPTGPVATANVTIMVADSGTPPLTDSQALSIQAVDPLIITTAVLPGTSVGAAYNQAVVATGGTTPYTYSISSGSLPAGLAISGTGAITGTATAAATNQAFTVMVADNSALRQSDTQTLAIGVTLEIPTMALADATSGVLYTQTLQVQGGQPPYQWARTAGSMPTGIADPVAATGVVSGTPASVCMATTSTFTARVTDSAAPPVSVSRAGLGITVNPGAALNITTGALPNGVVGTAYNVVVQVTGGVAPYSFSTSGTLPGGLGPINGMTGSIAGTPNTVESRTFDVIVSDSCGTMDTQSLTITVTAAALGRNDSIATATILPGNGTYSASISPSGNPNTILDPDEDFYRITTTANSTVTVDINAESMGSPLDSVIEVVGANGIPLNTCVAPAFNSICVHDDEVLGVVHDSILQIQVVGATTFYVHVVDWGGNGRPDLLYNLVISGVN